MASASSENRPREPPTGRSFFEQLMRLVGPSVEGQGLDHPEGHGEEGAFILRLVPVEEAATGVEVGADGVDGPPHRGRSGRVDGDERAQQQGTVPGRCRTPGGGSGAPGRSHARAPRRGWRASPTPARQAAALLGPLPADALGAVEGEPGEHASSAPTGALPPGSPRCRCPVPASGQRCGRRRHAGPARSRRTPRGPVRPGCKCRARPPPRPRCAMSSRASSAPGGSAGGSPRGPQRDPPRTSRPPARR